MTDRQKVRVVIIGGGTAGWMTAGALTKLLPGRCSVHLVESEAIGIVGVGEATLPHIRAFNERLGIDEADFMATTRATFKLGIEFQGWGRAGESYIHPFGTFGSGKGTVEFHHYWNRRRQETGTVPPIGEYSMAVTMAYMNRFTRPDPDPDAIESTFNYAYQFDATLFAPYLRRIAEGLGARRTEGRVVDVELDGDSGDVRAVRLESGERIEGDLFIDCSGFVSLIIGKALDEPFEDWSHWLPCDRAVAMPCRTRTALTPYTSAIAMPAGWRWRIPLQHRTGNGYVYSSSHISDDEVATALLGTLEGKALADPKVLRFKAGRRRKSWVKNCIALGLSSGFLEPLESTSIHLVQAGITKFLDFFPHRECDPILIDRYNEEMAFQYETVRDFIIAHYKVTEREDTEFWRYCRHMSIPDSLSDKLTLFRERSEVKPYPGDLFGDISWFAILYGQGLTPEGYHPLADAMSDDDLQLRLAGIRKAIMERVEALPAHSEFIRRCCAAQPVTTAA